MASGTTRVSDVVVPEIFSAYVRQSTREKSRIIRSGVVVDDPALNTALAGGGLTFNEPSWKDLDNDEENVASDDPAVESSPNKTGTSTEIQVRINRNQSWATMDLASQLAGDDAMTAIVDKVGGYWARRLQKMIIAMMNGIIADNLAAPSGTDTHTQGDLINDVSGSSFVNGVTNFSTKAFMNTLLTMGDEEDALGICFMHSVIYNTAKQNNLIDFVQDSINGQAISIPTFNGRVVVRDDGMPVNGDVYDTWILGAGAIRLGESPAEVPTEVDRHPEKGRGSGQEILYSRVQWCPHLVGHAYKGTPTDKGGPTNATTANNLAHADSWSRVWPERKQIPFAVLRTREA